jgi:hypothetical protein
MRIIQVICLALACLGGLRAQETITYDTLAHLLAIDPRLIARRDGSGNLKARVAIAGRTVKGDGGGGLLDLVTAVGAVTNTGTLFRSPANTNYAWSRLLNGTPINPLMFGALGNGTGDDSTAWRDAILFAKRGSTNANLGIPIVDGLGLRYRLTSAIGSLATDGYGSGVTIKNASWVQATDNTPILSWDLASTTNAFTGDGGWRFQNLAFNWATKPAPGHTNAVGFYLAAPKITNAARDYSLIYNSSFRDIIFFNSHTGFKALGKANVWGSSFCNLASYGNCVGPLVDFRDPSACQASSPGNQFRLLYARVDGYADTNSGGCLMYLNPQRDCIVDGFEINLARTNITSYLRIDGAQNVDIRNIRLEGNSETAGGWAPNFDGFVSLVGALSGIRVSGVSFQNVTVNGQGYLVRFPATSTAVDTTINALSLDGVAVASGALWGVGSTANGASGTMTPITQLSSSGIIGQIYPYDASSLIWSVRRASRQWTSADRGDASVTLVPSVDAGIQRFATTLTANRTITLGGNFNLGTVANGDEFLVMRTDLGAFSLAVGSVVTFAPGQTGSVLVRWVSNGATGGAWTLIGDHRARSVSGTVTITAQSIASGGQFTASAAVAGASFSGDRYTWSLPNGAGSSALVISAETASAGNAFIRFFNPTAGSITLPAQTITITRLFP